MPDKQNKPLVWKQGVDYIIYNPLRKSVQWDEWQKVKEKDEQKIRS